MTSNNKIWHCLKGDKRYEAKKYSFEKEDIAFAIVDSYGSPNRVYGDKRLANLFSNLIIRAASLTNGSDAKLRYATYNNIPNAVVREASNQDMTAMMIYNDKSELVCINMFASSIYSITLDKISAKTSVNPEKLKFRIDEAESSSVLNDDSKGVSMAISFPSKQELIERYGMQYIWDENGKMITNYKIVPDIESLKMYCTMVFPNVSVLAIDTETTGLNICSLPSGHKLKDTLVGISISWQLKQSIYIPVDHTEVANLDVKEVMRLLKPFLEKIPCIGANIIFDSKVFYEYGIYVNFTEDVLAMWYNINPSVAKLNGSLKYIVELKCGIKQPSLSEIAKGGERYVKYFPPHLIYCYCCADSDHTLLAYSVLKDIILPSSIYGYKQDIAMCRYLFIDEYYGVYFDTEFLHDAIKYAEIDKQRIEELMYSYVGQYILLKSTKLEEQSKGRTNEQIEASLKELEKTPEYKNSKYVFSPSKDQEMRRIFFDIFQMPPAGYTATNLPAIDKAAQRRYVGIKKKVPTDISQCWLKQNVYKSIAVAYNNVTSEDTLLDKEEFNKLEYPIVYLYAAWKLAYSELTKFFYPLREMTEGTSGVVYLSFRTRNTDTYRITHRLQTLKGILKKLVVPPSNYYNMGFDAAAIEYRNASGNAGQADLVEKLHDPEEDYHTLVASQAWQVPTYLVSKTQRKEVKPVNFGSIYGISAYGLCVDSFKMEPNKSNLNYCENLLTTIKNTVPYIFSFLDSCADFAVKNGYLLNADGRIRYFDLAHLSTSRVRRQALNYPIQSHSAGLFRRIYLNFKDEVKDQGLSDKVITYLLVHDELQNYIHESIHPYQLCSIVYNKCILHLDGHPPYFLGVGFGMTWYEAKSDRNELPIKFLEKKAKEWDEGKWKDHSLKASEVPDFVYKELQQYMFERYMLEMKSNGINFECIDLKEIVTYFKNYYILRRVEHFVELDIIKNNSLKLSYEQIALALLIAHVLKKSELQLNDGTTLTVRTLIRECVKGIKSDVLRYMEEYLVSDTLSEEVLHKNDMSLDLDFSFDEEAPNIELELSSSNSDDSTDSEFNAIYHAESILDGIDLFDDENDNSNSLYTEYDEDSLYEYELTLTNPDATTMADRYACNNIGKKPIDTKRDSGYEIIGQFINVKLPTKGYDKVIKYLSSLVTTNVALGHTLTYTLPDKSVVEFKHLILKPDESKLNALLNNKEVTS